MKQYLAFVEGTCQGKGQCIDYLYKDTHKGRPRVRIVPKAHPGAQYAELVWRVLGHHNGGSLLEITLKTGRPHQIRIQLAHNLFPIRGDIRYGAQQRFSGKDLALHWYRLGIEHPISKEFMIWEAAPLDWDAYRQIMSDNLN